MDNIPQINLILNFAGLLLGGGALGLFLRYRLGMRRLGLDAEEAIRKHYAEELAALRSKLNEQEKHFQGMEKHWREMLEASDRRHQACEDARTDLRRELDELHAELSGIHRQIAEQSSDKLLILEKEGGAITRGFKPSDIAPTAAKAAERVKRITDNGDK